MLCTMNDLLRKADAGNYGMGAFNFANAETLLAIYEASQEQGMDAMLIGSAEENLSFGLKKWVELVEFMARDFDISVCLHLDHCTDIEYITDCMKAGVRSVMYDGSFLPYEDNIRNTAEVVRRAADFGATVEGEIGHIGRCDDLVFEGTDTKYNTLTDPREAREFVDATGVDAIAVSIGNAHGLSKALPVLDFELLEEIVTAIDGRARTVLHGGSGIPADQLRRAVNLGIRKVNVASEIGRAYVSTLSSVSENEWWGHGVTAAKAAVKEVVLRWIAALSQDKR